MKSSEENDFIKLTFTHYGRMVLQIAYQNTANMSEAEDITQEVFLKLMKNISGLNNNDEEHIKAWLIRVTINQCKDYFKSFRYRKNIALTESNLSSEPYMDNYLDIEDKQIFEELKKLPAKYRNIIYLYYIEEYTVPEIANLLAAKENTVSSWLRRAKRKLKMNMEGEGIYEEGRLY
ncbi:RNA polymerase sigma factor [Anaerocolumna sp. MB42-C2]|uniref:RNA polymerase sigma factor n=1 Tax=Anaerocolumna sp. MB42-C2 TaxID=3070997 RepID=UPI0027E189BB|nr:sigma-70 family RNA polymerase sigma factor [Anaerocolumna sp. MB42-C2]WMJ86288.1 sigma-70 family RNA polymerase sigma factor [Anaerocolumna sp. MB42-C2]